jgi:hypothetical protein
MTLILTGTDNDPRHVKIRLPPLFKEKYNCFFHNSIIAVCLIYLHVRIDRKGFNYTVVVKKSNIVRKKPNF